MAVRGEADGVAVVLVHGLALDARMWDDQVPVLEQIARVVRYDLRGFGRSTRDADTSYSHADDLWRLLDHLGIAPAGHMVNMEAPEAVNGLLRDLVLDRSLA